jgi:outer membrane receptor protein involved in Fe transport
MIKSPRGLLVQCAGILLSPFAALSAAVAADSTATSITGAAEQAGGLDLEEITVTATRREESSERVPISIMALGQDQLMDLGVKDIASLAAMTPGLQYDVPNGYASTITTLSIRGMNTQVGANVVGIYYDDTPIQSRLPAYGNIGTPVPLTFDMQRVEVERGPQGTLFGAGSEAGTVRFIPNDPSVTKASGLAQAGVAVTQGGGPSYTVGGAYGGPIIDGVLGFRASVFDQQDGGYINRINPLNQDITATNANADNKSSERLALTWEPTADLRITPAIYHQQIHQSDSGRFFGAYGSDPSAGIFVNGTFVPEVSNDEFSLPTLKVQATLPFADVTFDSSYIHRTVRLNADASVFFGGYYGPKGFGDPRGASYPTSPLDYSPLLVLGSLEGYTEELRFASNQPGAFVSWVAGIFYDHRKQREFQGSYTSAFGDPSFDSYVVDGRMTDDQLAGFVNLDFHLTQKLTATLGERVAHVLSKETDYNGTGFFNSGEPAVGSSSESETPNTPRVALSYQFDSSHLLYAAMAKGFRVGGGNAPIADFCGFPAPPYESDYDWSYEIGTKDQLLDNRLQIDASAFHVKWSRIQQIVIPACGTAFASNTADAAFNGFDLQAQALLTERLRVDLAVGYVNAYFTDSYFIAPGVPLALEGDKVGQLPQVNPPWTVNLGVDYSVPVLQGDRLRWHGEYQFKSSNPGPFITQIPNSPDYYNAIVADPSTTLVKGRVEYEHGALLATLYADNLLNSHPSLGAFQFPVSSNIVTYSTFRPRTLGLDLQYRF